MRGWGRFLLVMAATAGLVTASTLITNGQRRAVGFTRSAEQAESYFRMQVSLAHGDEPVSLNIVVGCKVSVTTYKDNDRSVYAARHPRLYAQATRDGHVVGVQVPDMCSSGETSDNGRVPPDFLPVVIWYERADDLSLGTLFASEDAYERPGSPLGFRSASIHRASPAEYEAFLAREPRNLISPESQLWLDRDKYLREVWSSPELMANPRVAARYAIPVYCYGVIRLKLPEEARAEVRSMWPEARSRFWVLDHRRYPDFLNRLYADDPMPDTKVRTRLLDRYRPPLSDGVALGGLTTRTGGGKLGGRSSRRPPEYYPIRRDDALPWISAELSEREVAELAAEIDPAHRGTLYCYDIADPTVPPVVERVPGLEHMPGVLRADGNEVARLDAWDRSLRQPRMVFFERDEYIHQLVRFIL